MNKPLTTLKYTGGRVPVLKSKRPSSQVNSPVKVMVVSKKMTPVERYHASRGMERLNLKK